jgi:hypothetical protein
MLVDKNIISYEDKPSNLISYIISNVDSFSTAPQHYTDIGL